MTEVIDIDTERIKPYSRIEALTAIHHWFYDPSHLLGQSEDGTMCVYRGKNEDGNSDASSLKRCSIGCILPDWAYNPKMEGKGFGDLVDVFPIVKALFYEEDRTFFSAVQTAHDDFAASGSDMTPDGRRQLFVAWLDSQLTAYELYVN